MSTELLSAPSPARPADGPARPRILTTVSQLADLAPGWEALAAGCGPVEQFAWSQACAETIAAGRKLAVVALERSGGLDAVAPLVWRRVCGIGRLVQLGVGELYEPMDFAARDSDRLALLARTVVRLGRPVWLERLPADSPLFPALARAARGRALIVRRAGANCPHIRLDAAWLEPERQLNSGRRSDLRRAVRKAEQLGPVTSEVLIPSPDDVDALFDEAVAVEARSWKGNAGTALACDPRRAAFYRCYARSAAQAGVLRIGRLQIGGQSVAMQLAVEQGGGFWLLKVGYDEAFSACSPGLLLMRDTIRYAAQAGLASYEFLGRAEAWTRVWTAEERQTVSLRIYPYGVRGLTALALDAACALAARRKKS